MKQFTKIWRKLMSLDSAIAALKLQAEKGNDTSSLEKLCIKNFHQLIHKEQFYTLPFSKVKAITKGYKQTLTKENAILLISSCSRVFGKKTVRLLPYLSLDAADDNTILDVILSISQLPFVEQYRQNIPQNSFSDDQNDMNTTDYFDESEESTSFYMQKKVQKHKVKIIEPNMEQTIKVPSPSFDDYKTIHDAVQVDNINVMKAFLRNNHSLISSKDGHEYTPLHIAAKYSSFNCAKQLLKEKAKINERSQAGRSPLHIAVIAGNIEMVQLLLDAGASIDSQDDNGSTPLHYAVSWNKLDIVELLLLSGARILIRNKKGETYIVLWHRWYEIMNLKSVFTC